MIYYVTKQTELQWGAEFTKPYRIVTVEESLKFLESLENVGLDTETSGLEVHGGMLYTLQLGNFEYQVVIDCTTIDVKQYKEYLESDRTFIVHNAKFDLKWLYKEGIVVKNVFDTFLAEKILFLGFPSRIVSVSLQACLDRYFGIYLDKSVRGMINEGMSDSVIVYAANDVKYLEQLMDKQKGFIHERNQDTALQIENDFVRVLAYVEFCGIKLDTDKWRDKMKVDKNNVRQAEQALNEWVIDYVQTNKPDTILKNFIPTKKNVKNLKAWVVETTSTFFEESKVTCMINWNSPSQVIELFEELGFNLWVKDKKTGNMKKSVDMNLVAMQTDKSPIADIYIKYSKAYKVVSSFGENFIRAINPVTGRIHAEFNQLMDTGRMSCGSNGKGGSFGDNSSKDESINLQQLPNNKETRGAFVAEDGNMLIDCDYGDQEGHMFTELSGDKEWIKFYNDENKRDGHGFVAKMCFPKELEGIDELSVKKERDDLRQLAKKARFCFNYNGQAHTMAVSCNIPEDFANEIFKAYFKKFNGIADYFKKQKRDMWNRGYILISERTGLRSYVWDWPTLRGIEKRKDSIHDFWNIYKEAKNSGLVIWNVPDSVMFEICEGFAEGRPIEELAKTYYYTERSKSGNEAKHIDINKETVYTTVMKHFFKRRSDYESRSCNYPSQGTSAAMTKIALSNYFKHLEEDNLLFKVKIVNIVHDEGLVEVPEEIVEQEAERLSYYMEESARIFCKKVTIKAEPEYAEFWKH